MELIIKDMALPEAIDFNFEEIKQELSNKVSEYTNLVYTDDQVKDAKKDVAELRKFQKALSEQRISIKKEYLKPFEEFEGKVKELESIVGEPIQLIDKQIKDYAEAAKREKYNLIVSIYEKTNHPDWLTLGMIFDEKWLNTSANIKNITTTIESIVTRINIDLVTLRSLPEFGFEATEVYKSTLDINEAISEGRRLSEIQKRKKEEEQAKIEAANEMEQVEIDEQSSDVEEVEGFIPDYEEVEGFIPSFDDNQAIWRNYRIELTTDQKEILDAFLDGVGIKYQVV